MREKIGKEEGKGGGVEERGKNEEWKSRWNRKKSRTTELTE